jgi:hypothetical protein
MLVPTSLSYVLYACPRACVAILPILKTNNTIIGSILFAKSFSTSDAPQSSAVNAAFLFRMHAD